MSHDPHHGILRQRTGSPGFPSCGLKPRLHLMVPHVSGIDKGDENVDVQKVAHYSNSSANCFTISEVTGGASWRLGSIGMPFLVFVSEASVRNAFLARLDTISPMLHLSIVASSRTADRISSSIVRVVLKVSSLVLVHQASEHHNQSRPGLREEMSREVC